MRSNPKERGGVIGFEFKQGKRIFEYFDLKIANRLVLTCVYGGSIPSNTSQSSSFPLSMRSQLQPDHKAKPKSPSIRLFLALNYSPIPYFRISPSQLAFVPGCFQQTIPPKPYFMGFTVLLGAFSLPTKLHQSVKARLRHQI